MEFETSRAFAISELLQSYTGVKVSRAVRENENSVTHQICPVDLDQTNPEVIVTSDVNSSSPHGKTEHSVSLYNPAEASNENLSPVSQLSDHADVTDVSYFARRRTNARIHCPVQDRGRDVCDVSPSSYRKHSLPVPTAIKSDSKRTESLPILPMVDEFLDQSLGRTPEGSISPNSSSETLSSDAFIPEYFQKSASSQWISMYNLDEGSLNDQNFDKSDLEINNVPPLPPRSHGQKLLPAKESLLLSKPSKPSNKTNSVVTSLSSDSASLTCFNFSDLPDMRVDTKRLRMQRSTSADNVYENITYFSVYRSADDMHGLLDLTGTRRSARKQSSR